MDIRHIILPIAGLALLAACNPKPAATDDSTAAQPEVVVAGFEDTVQLELKPVNLTKGESYFDKKAKSPSPANTAAAAQRKQDKGQAETIYVETDGAQGRVWGHVTMKGDRGTGTIHDWDENTLTVSVTRHGDELFAVDQNSRQYVFKLKKNKTQE